MAKIAVVIPSARHVRRALTDHLGDADEIIVVQDSPDLIVDDPGVRILSEGWQRETFGSDLDIIGKGSAACRNAGIFWACKNGFDYIVNLDDDLVPLEDG